LTADVSAYLEDAAHFPGGHARGVVLPRDVADVVRAVVSARSVLPIGAQSSLTGGATPFGETILATSKMNRILEVSPAHIRVEAGVTVAAMQERLAAERAWFPPAPTFTGACAGGIVATNAAGPATFKYGTTRDWVERITVVLADGTVLDAARGERRARGRALAIETPRGTASVVVPSYRMPHVAKLSAGYFAAPDMDLLDLFIGSEGTLGIVTDVTFRVVSPAPAIAFALIACASETQGLQVVSALRRASLETRRAREARGIDVAAIEHLDRRSIAIAREDGVLARHNVTLPADTAFVLIVQLELPAGTDPRTAYDEIAGATESSGADTPLARFCRLLDAEAVLDRTEIALPSERRRIADFVEVREAVPAGVNQRVGHARRTVDDRISKTAADMIVPFDRFAEMMAIYERGFASRGLDFAIWGHASDGNVHPNVIPRSFDDVEKGREAILEFGREAARLGGSPLAEHGVGRNPTKQALLEQLYGTAGIEEMRAVKRALDPEWKLAPGVIFPF
jgi:D-lactate dehydrogenase (cytochrome)